jgi:hypothetical protein
MWFANLIKWLFERFVTKEHFMNAIALLVVLVLCYKEVNNSPSSNTFMLLSGMVLAYYFKQPKDEGGSTV